MKKCKIMGGIKFFLRQGKSEQNSTLGTLVIVSPEGERDLDGNTYLST